MVGVWSFFVLHLSLAGNLGRLTWVRLLQPQEQRYPFLPMCAVFLCVNSITANVCKIYMCRGLCIQPHIYGGCTNTVRQESLSDDKWTR